MQHGALERIFSSWVKEVEKGLVVRDSLWTPAMVSGVQSARTVVLRGLQWSSEGNKPSLTFYVHTDVRSRKWQELRHNPSCCLHFYCAARRWQMRVDTYARLSHEDEEARAAWRELPDHTKRIYSLKHAPGTAVGDPKEAFMCQGVEQGFEHFGVIGLRALAMESLQLQGPDRSDYHVRARWELDDNGEMTYLAP